jgi:hypothetical protein
MYGLRKDQIGTLATDTEKTVWPKFDIEGNTYDRSVATVKYLRGSGGGKSTLFAVIPPGRTWEPGDVNAKHPDELAAEEAAQAKAERAAHSDDSAKRSAIEAAAKDVPVRKAGGNASLTD